MSFEKNYQTVLINIAEEVSKAISSNDKRQIFEKQVQKFINAFNHWKNKVTEEQLAAKDNPKMNIGKEPVDDGSDGLLDNQLKNKWWQSVNKNNPDGYEIYSANSFYSSDYIIDEITGYYYAPKLPPNPVETLRPTNIIAILYPDSNITENPIKERDPADAAEDLMRKYFLLAVIHSYIGESVPLLDRNCEAAELVWFMYENMDERQEHCWGPRVRNLLMTALNHVKVDLCEQTQNTAIAKMKETQERKRLKLSADKLEKVICRLAVSPNVKFLENIQKAKISVERLVEPDSTCNSITNEEGIYAEAAVIEYLTNRFGEQDDAVGNWPRDWNECPEAYELYEEKIKEFRTSEALSNIEKLETLTKNLEINTNLKKAKQKKRPTAAEMRIRNKAVAMAAAELQAKYDRLPSVNEIMNETKFTAHQIYATDSYKEGKIAKKTSKTVSDMAGSSVTTSEQFGDKTIEHSRAKRRSNSQQAELEAFIDQQEKDKSSNFVL